MMKAFEDIKRNFCGQRRPGKIHDLPCAMEKLDLDDENVRKKYDPVERVVKLSWLVPPCARGLRLTN
jgi:hypothetical protein